MKSMLLVSLVLNLTLVPAAQAEMTGGETIACVSTVVTSLFVTWRGHRQVPPTAVPIRNTERKLVYREHVESRGSFQKSGQLVQLPVGQKAPNLFYETGFDKGFRSQYHRRLKLALDLWKRKRFAAQVVRATGIVGLVMIALPTCTLGAVEAKEILEDPAEALATNSNLLQLSESLGTDEALQIVSARANNVSAEDIARSVVLPENYSMEESADLN